LNLATHFVEARFSQSVMIIEKPQPLSDDFTCRLVAAAPDFAFDELDFSQ
jgi:hypothetical protein